MDGLDVIDFPGVDDVDESIPDLADLLLNLAQIAVFVVDYRYCRHAYIAWTQIQFTSQSCHAHNYTAQSLEILYTL